MLVEHARDASLVEHATEDDLRETIAAYFAAASVTSAADAHLKEGDPTPEEWLVYLVKNGSYNNRPPNLNVFTRARELFVNCPARLVDDNHYCPIDEWFREDFGLNNAAEQHAVGSRSMRLAAPWTTIQLGRPSVVPPPFADGPLGDRTERSPTSSARRASGTPTSSQHSGTTSTASRGSQPTSLRRPFLRLADGPLAAELAADDRQLARGEVFYHLALESARRRGSDDCSIASSPSTAGLSSTTASTWYAGACSATIDRSVAGRVYGEQSYGRHGGKRTSDVAIDLGTDLVLIEVVAARFATDVRVYGNPDVLSAALERMIFKKIGQLGRVTAAILTGEATIPDVVVAHIERVWPIVVTGGDLMHTELLWDRIDAELPAELRGASATADRHRR